MNQIYRDLKVFIQRMTSKFPLPIKMTPRKNSISKDKISCNMKMLMKYHYNDVIMGAIASQITSFTIVYSIVYLDADQRKHQSSVSLAFVRGIGEFPAQMANYAENVSI